MNGENGILNKNYTIKFRITDIIYVSVVLFIFFAFCEFFYRQTVMYGGMYASDTIVYVEYAKDGSTGLRAIEYIFSKLYMINENTFEIAVFMAMVIIGIVIVNYMLIHYLLKGWSQNHRIVVQVASLTALFTSPIYIIGVYEHFYQGTWSKFAWQSPTQQMMTLFSLISFMLFLKIHENYYDRISVFQWIGLAAAFLISAWAKPSFIMCFFPIVAIVLIKDFICKRKHFELKKRIIKILAFGSTMAPAFCYFLLINSSLYGGGGDGSNHVVVSFAYFFKRVDHPIMMIVTSLALPIVVLIFNFGSIKKDVSFNIAWGVFALGLLEYLTFIEEGTRTVASNFSWGRMIGCYLIFLVSISKLIENYYDKNFMKGKRLKRKCYFVITIAMIICSIISQIMYISIIFTGESYYI